MEKEGDWVGIARQEDSLRKSFDFEARGFWYLLWGSGMWWEEEDIEYSGSASSLGQVVAI